MYFTLMATLSRFGLLWHFALRQEGTFHQPPTPSDLPHVVYPPHSTRRVNDREVVGGHVPVAWFDVRPSVFQVRLFYALRLGPS